jgi:enediyne biosynthesis protein E4
MSGKRQRTTCGFTAASLLLPLALMLVPSPAAATFVVPATGDWVINETVSLSGAPFHIHGNVIIEPGESLTLTGAILYLEDDASWVSLMDGARLTLLSGAAIKDSTADTDDGSANDWTYTIAMSAGSRLEVTAGSLEGSGGLDATDATVALRDANVKANEGPVRLMGASSLTALNTSFTQNSAPLLDLQGTSTAEIRGKSIVPYTIGPLASLTFASFAAVSVNDTSGKPLAGADWSFETAGGVLGGSPAAGGLLTTTRVDMEGHSTPIWVLVPYLTDMGGAKSYAGVVARVTFAEWSDARAVDTSMDRLLNFTARNHGVSLEDVSMEAMLDVYHGMSMGMDMGMGMGNTSTMGGMGGMDMMGPMQTQGPGSAWGDFNGDGKVDVIVTAAPETDEMALMGMMMNVTDYPAPQLFLGRGDGMFDHEMMSGLEGAMGAQGVSAGDFDGDGHLDLFVARYGNAGTAMEDAQMAMTFMDGMPLKSMIFRGDGKGMFMDVTDAVHFDMPARYTTGGVWNDYNRDGCLDLYVVNMGQMAMAMMEGAPMGDMSMGMNFVRPQANYLYKNNCDGTFTDVTAPSGAPTGGGAPGSESPWLSLAMDPVAMYWYANLTGRDTGGSGVSYTAAFFDYNEDGWPDLLVGNDFGISPLYRNNGDGTFTLQTVQAGFNKVGSAMGFAIADYNRDGHLDVFQSNFNEDYLWMANGDSTFTDRAYEYGVADMAVGWGVAAPDLNNDGFPDIVISTGYMSMMMKASERSSLYINDAGKRFWDGSAGSGIDADPAQGISLATADVNADGKLDLFLGKITGMNRLYLNREVAGKSVHIDFQGLVSNSFGVGAEVTAMIAGKPFRAVVQPGGEYASSNEPGLTIGVGSEMEARDVVIHWPSGTVQWVGEVMEGARVTARELVTTTAVAGPNGFAKTDVGVSMVGTTMGSPLTGATYTWTFTGVSGNSTLTGKNVTFVPQQPGVYVAEFKVTDRFGTFVHSSTCLLTVADATPPVIDIKMPSGAVTASGKTTFDATGTTDNDPAFARGAATYTWTFTNGALPPVSALGAKPTVTLPKAGTWTGTLNVTDGSGNSIQRSFDVRVSGAAAVTVTSDMVLWAMFLTTASIVGIALASTRIWRPGHGEGITADHFAELRPHDIVVAEVSASDAPPFPYRPKREGEEE